MTRGGFEAIAKSKDTELVIKEQMRITASGFEEDFEEEFISKQRVKEAIEKHSSTNNGEVEKYIPDVVSFMKELGLD